MQRSLRVGLTRPFPIYKQLVSDNSCGPRAILMAADYFERERGTKLFAHEWSRVLEITMGNDLVRDAGTPREDMLSALSAIGLKARLIRGSSPELSRKALRRALERDHPVIVWCSIPYAGKPARHYAVLVEMDNETLYLADSFPHKDVPQGLLRAVEWLEFRAGKWSKGATTWGRDRWAVEVAPGPSSKS